MIASPLAGALTGLADFGDELPDRIEVVAAFDGPAQVYAVTPGGTRKEPEIGLPWQQWVANQEPAQTQCRSLLSGLLRESRGGSP